MFGFGDNILYIVWETTIILFHWNAFGGKTIMYRFDINNISIDR